MRPKNVSIKNIYADRLYKYEQKDSEAGTRRCPEFFHFIRKYVKKSERGIRYGNISRRDKEESICAEGSDYTGQKHAI